MTTIVRPSQNKVVGQNTTMATWAGAIARALAGAGVDAEALFAEAGIDFGLVNRPDKRIPVDDMTRLWHLATQASGDPAFGMAVARQVNLTTFHALGVAAMASQTVTEAADMITRFATIVSDGIDMQVRLGEEEVGLVMGMRPGYPRFADPCVEAALAAIVLTARQLVPSMQLERVSFRHRCAGDPARYRELFGCPVAFGAGEDGIFGGSDLLATDTLPGSSPAVARVNEALCEEYLASRAGGDTTSRVRELIASHMARGEQLPLSRVASALAMSERKLQRLLRDEGVHYRDVLDEERARIAANLLSRDDQSIGRVAEKLGFDSLSAFSRAFKRWYDQSPRDYRQAARRPAGS